MKTAGDGASVEDHLAVLRGRVDFIAVPEPECPAEIIYIWNSWVELNGARASGGFAPNPISWTEIDGYCRVTRVDLLPWEARAIRAIDEVYLSTIAEDRAGMGDKA